MKVRGEDVFINTNIVRWWDELAGYFTYMSSIAACPLPFSVIAVWFAVENIFSIVTLLGELAYMYGDSQPSSTVHTTVGMETYIPLSLCYATWHPMTTTIHHWWNGNIYSIVTVLGDLAPGDSHPSYKQCRPFTACTVYTVLYDVIKQHGHYLCSVWWIWTTLPVHKMQSTFAISQHPEYFL